jgi:hypothetical protein
MFDVWKRAGNGWIKKDTSYAYIVNRSYHQQYNDTLITQNNVDFNVWYDLLLFSADRSIVIRKSAPVYPLGLTFKAYRSKEQEAQHQVISVSILKRRY